jgi:hypothetical protein
LIFALIFVVAFVFGFISYAFTQQWILAVSIPSALFVASTFSGNNVAGAQAFTLTFGVPIVFFAALLGAYVYQIRNLEDHQNTSASRDSVNEIDKSD